MATISGISAAVAAAALAALASSAVTASEGRVIEAGTGTALAGVFVIARWEGNASIAVQPRHTCYDADVVMTDSSGRYKVRDYSGNVNPLISERRRWVTFYKPGYREVHRNSPKEDIVTMARRDEQSREQSFVQVSETNVPDDCGIARRKILSLLKAMYAELTSLAVTREEKERAEGTRYAIETIELGPEVADRNLDQRFRTRSRGDAK